MTTRTERADEIFCTIILFVITAVWYFLAWIFLANGKVGFGIIIMMAAIAGTILTLASIYVVLVRRWAERKKV